MDRKMIDKYTEQQLLYQSTYQSQTNDQRRLNTEAFDRDKHKLQYKN